MVRMIQRKFHNHKPVLKPWKRRATLDPTMIFDSAKQPIESNIDVALTKAILMRNTYLAPTIEEQTAIASLMSKVQHILETLIVAPGDFNACKVDAVCQVGSYKKDTMLRGRNVADIVVVLRNPPTKETFQGLLTKMQDDMKNLTKTEIVMRAQFITIEANDNGIDVLDCCARVRVLIATKNTRELHVNANEMDKNLLSIKHIRWFETAAQHSTVKSLIRILRDATERFEGLKMLDAHTIDVLVHFASIHHPTGEVLPIHKAFRRIFQLLAAGIFLPGNSGIPDPCNDLHKNIASSMTLEEKDVCCTTAQTLLRTLLNGGYNNVLGNEDGAAAGGNWNSVNVLPSQTVFVSPKDVAVPAAQPEE